jgi:molybdopterin converting factor small subunit
MIRVEIQFYSYFKEKTGCERTSEEMFEGSTLGDLLIRLHARYPELAGFSGSMLLAVGVEYQRGDYVLKDGDEVSLFPPVQGG